LLRPVFDGHPNTTKVGDDQLLDVLLLIAALRRSLFAVVTHFAFGFSHMTARRALDTRLPDTETLREELVAALHFFQSQNRRQWRKRRWVIAIDTHLAPFYGDRAAPGIVGGKKKQGTKYFYGYATAVLIHHRARYTVGLLALDPSMKPHEVVAALLEQCHDNGLRVSGVLLDAGFGGGDVLLHLQAAGLSYVVPLQRCGNGGGPRNRRFDAADGSVADLTWRTERSRRAVTTATVVVRRSRDGATKLYAFGGWDAESALAAVSRAAVARVNYRRRFGIETSYRQLNEWKGRTTSKDVAYRLLLVGLALLLRQVWVYLTGLIARRRGLGPDEWVAELPAQDLRAWLEAALRLDYNKPHEIDLRRPGPIK